MHVMRFFVRPTENFTTKNFSDLYEEQSKYGQLSNEYLNSYSGFRRNINYAGTKVNRMSDVESWQRAKCLSSTYQRRLRLQKTDGLKVFPLNKATTIQANHDDIHANNISCITKLLSVVNPCVMSRSHNTDPSLSLLSLHEFSMCILTLLKYFARVRTVVTPKQTADAGFILPTNKGKLCVEVNGEINLISLAHKLRASMVVLTTFTNNRELIADENTAISHYPEYVSTINNMLSIFEAN